MTNRPSLDGPSVAIDTRRARCKMCIMYIDDSPSDDFCSENCQWMWWWERSGRTDPELMARVRSLDDQVTAMLHRQCPTAVQR